jgi:hypothetical protein
MNVPPSELEVVFRRVAESFLARYRRGERPYLTGTKETCGARAWHLAPPCRSQSSPSSDEAG